MIRERVRQKLNESIYSINAAALLLGAATLLSRILGVLRDRMLAGHFGASRELDIYYAAFQIPDFLFNLFLIGAASTAIIPIFLEVKRENESEARELVYHLLEIFFAVSIIVSAVMIIVMPYLMYLVTPGFSPSEISLTVTLARIMMASPVLLGLSGIISSVVQAYRKFLAFALSPIFYNLGIIFGIFFFLPALGLPGLALGVILGAVLHFLVQWITFAGLGFKASSWKRDRNSLKFSEPLKKIVRLSLPRVIATSISNITAIFLVAISSTLIAGSISVFTFSDNLSGLPIGIFGVSFAVAAFPALSEYFMKKDPENYFDTFFGSLRSILFWILPLTVFFYVLRAQIVRVALGAGKFNWTDTRLTAASLGIMVIAMVSNSVIPILIRSFYALGNTKRPLLINLFTAVFTVALAFLFIGLIQHNTTFSFFLNKTFKVEGIKGTAVLGVALALSIGTLSDLFLLTMGSIKEAKRKFKLPKDYYIKTPWMAITKMFVSALIAGFISFEVLRLVNKFITLDTFKGVLTQGALAFAAGSLAYGLLLYALGNKEIRNLMEIFKRRMMRLKFLPWAWGNEEQI